MSLGLIKRGTIIKYDEKSLTVTIQPDGVGGVIHNVICPFTRYDLKNNAYSFNAPSDGAPCLYTEVNDSYYLLELVPPRNYTDDGYDVENSTCDNQNNMAPAGWPNGKVVKAGEETSTNATGSEDTFTDTMKKIIMVPKKLESLWNVMNCIWTNTCLIFRLFSGPLDVTAEVTQEDECNTTVKVRKTIAERKDGAKTLVDLRIGKDAGIIELKINGSPLLHIYENKDILLIANDIKVNAKKIEYVADEVNMLNVGKVYLP